MSPAALLLALLSPAAGIPPDDGPPPIPREFRAAWVATVANIDWPSRPGLPADDQRREAVAILDRCRAAGLNAVILQVRPAADALYASDLEPWSAYLTGAQGTPPGPPYDPLAFWIDEAHRRGLQLHAWFNPFRARQAGAKYEEAPTHVARAHPGLVRRYGDLLWMDPGEPEARARTLAAVLDVVRRYDVDGVHIDDYFYPYPIVHPETKREIDFPDTASYGREHTADSRSQRADWRRGNISRLVRELYEGIKREKRHVLFGISPFGIPRPGRPPGVVGFDQYDKLYADTEAWLAAGWCDYWTPQLYWTVDASGQPFRPLLEHWVAGNAQRRHVWPGLNASRIGREGSGFDPEEILRQIDITRATPGSTGVVLFSMKPLLEDRRGIATALGAGPFRGPALVPASPWLGEDAPAAPAVRLEGQGGAQVVAVEPGAGPSPSWWAVQTRRGPSWTAAIVSASLRAIDPGPGAIDEVVVAGVGPTGVAGPAATARADGKPAGGP